MEHCKDKLSATNNLPLVFVCVCLFVCLFFVVVVVVFVCVCVLDIYIYLFFGRSHLTSSSHAILKGVMLHLRDAVHNVF